MNVLKLKAALALNDVTREKLANTIGICPETFTRKVKSDAFLIREVKEIAKVLHLSREDTNDIFLS